MNDEIPEIVDRSRVDAYAVTRRRAMFLHSIWRPMLAGAAGAALMMGCVWIVLPKVSYRDVEIPRVKMADTTVPNIIMRDAVVPNIVNKDVSVPNVVLVPRDVQVDRVVPHDVPVDRFVPHDTPFSNFVPHDVQIDVPRVVTAPAPLATPTETQAETQAPRSPEERAFIDTEEWRDAVIRGRILRSDKNGFVVSTAVGEWGFWPAKLNAAGKLEPNPLFKDQVEDFIGDLTRCNRQSNKTYRCFALHNGREVLIPQTPIGRPT
jgi:hypothetical protein